MKTAFTVLSVQLIDCEAYVWRALCQCKTAQTHYL